MAQVLQFASADAPAAVPEAESDGFVMTETAQDILRSLALIRSINGSALTMVSGAPGIGKTETLKHYARLEDQAAIYLAVAKDEGNPWHLATALMAEFGDSPRKRGNDLNSARRLVSSYIGPRRILLVDEAQNLWQRHKYSGTRAPGFGWLVAAAEEGGFDLVFCGDLSLQTILMDFPHILSRMRRPVVIKAAPRGDVEALAASEGVTDPKAVAALAGVAALPGGLRNVENVLRMAQLFAQRGAPTPAHIKAAILDLKLAPKGAQ